MFSKVSYERRSVFSKNRLKDSQNVAKVRLSERWFFSVFRCSGPRTSQAPGAEQMLARSGSDSVTSNVRLCTLETSTDSTDYL